MSFLFTVLVNFKKILVLKGTEIFTLKLESLQVGQIVRILRDELIPADLVLLKSSSTDGLCYLETSAIDGESNLKLRQANTRSYQLENASIVCDPPNNEIYNFHGSLQLSPSEVLPLDSNQFLPRGSILVNTNWIIGVIVYSGIETKIMKNVKENSRRKSTKMDKLNDVQTAQIVGILFVLVFILFFGHIYYNSFILPKHYYLRFKEPQEPFAFAWKYFADFVTFILLLNNLVPISLSVTLEVVRAILSHLINNDLDIYDAELQIPSKAQSSNVLDELGRIEYIMTDKTGTLTCNQMKLEKLLINGQIYENCLDSKSFLMNLLRNDALSPSRLFIEQFVEAMALCHTVMIDNRSGEFQASSPDELALVNSAKQLGCSFVSRTFEKIEIIQGHVNNLKKIFNLKAVIEFTSERKRMSVVLENDQNKKIFILTKGAETSIFPLCKKSETETLSKADKVVEEFSIEGLRTLCFACREISSEEFSLWFSQWTAAINTIGPGRKENLNSAAAAIEIDLQLIGVSGIEDRLQPGVPEAITALLKANIKIWILTGDRAETATNTAYLCGLLKPNHILIKLLTPEDLSGEFFRNSNFTEGGYALVISGDIFALILSDTALRHQFILVAANSRALIACRLSPLQKTEITKLVQVEFDKTTLAIGDGGNDVGMIQAAHVGIGINGLEGSQAARSADFSIAKFRFIVKLLLVHGAWSFHRISRVILYTIYKNFILVLCQFFFSFNSSFSGQSAFGSLFLLFYNSFFSVCPPAIIGLTDQYVTAPELIKNPQLYRFGQKGKFYNAKAFWECIINAAVQSLTISVCFHFLIQVDPGGIKSKPANLSIYGDILYFIILITISIKVLLFTNYFTSLMSLALITSLIICFLILWIKTAGTILTSALFFTASILIPIVTLLRDFLWKFYCRQFKPRAYHIIQEMRAVERRRTSRLSKSKAKIELSKTSSFENETAPLNRN